MDQKGDPFQGLFSNIQPYFAVWQLGKGFSGTCRNAEKTVLRSWATGFDTEIGSLSGFEISGFISWQGLLRATVSIVRRNPGLCLHG